MWLLVMATPGLAWAQVTSSVTMAGTPPSDTPSINVGATIFADFTAQTSPKSTDAAGRTITPSSFNVSRAYINITGNVSHIVQFRITPDIARETFTGPALSGSQIYRVKYAFIQFNLDDWTGNFKGSWVRFGVQQNVFIDFQESVYRYRFQTNVFLERTGLIGSADVGATFHTNLPNNFGDIHFGVYNGEGQNKPELNEQKAFQFRGTFRPFARSSKVSARGLRITGFVVRDAYQNDQERNRTDFNLMYEHKHFNTGYDYVTGADQTAVNSAERLSNGWSFWATPFFKEKGNGPEGLIRVDSFTPDKNNKTTATAALAPYKRLIAGIAFWFPHTGTQTASILFNVDRQWFGAFPNSGPTSTVNKVQVNFLLNF
jgi:hypothetical protein